MGKIYRLVPLLTLLFVGLLLSQNCTRFHVQERAVSFSRTSLGEDSDPFLEHPQSQVIEFQQPLALSVKLRAFSPASENQNAEKIINYQWRFRRIGANEWEAISGATEPSLEINHFLLTNQGDYQMEAMQGETRFISRIASIRVRNQSNTCLREDLSVFADPLRGAFGKDWAIVNYVDQDLETGKTLDYRGYRDQFAMTYDGHKGIDMAIGSFLNIDSGVPVYSIASGVVEIVEDGEFDRNTEWEMAANAKGNYVVLRHPNGFTTGFLHLRTNSIVVKVGDEIDASSIIAHVGSSGNSDAPHLHLETRDCSGKSIDLMKPLQFQVEWPYTVEKGELNHILFQEGAINNLPEAKLAVGPQVRGSTSGQIISYVATFFNIKADDNFNMEFLRPNGKVGFEQVHAPKLSPGTRRGAYRFFNRFHMDEIGMWKIRLLLNDTIVFEENWKVTAD